jgi:O-antigen ligase
LHGKIIPGILTATIALPAVYFSINELLNKVTSPRLKFSYAFFIIVTFLGVLLSGERIAFLIITTGYLIILGVIAAKNIRFSAIALSLLIITILGFTFTFSQLFTRQITHIYSDVINFKQGSYFKAYQRGYHVAKENIIFGVGTKNFYHVCSTILPQHSNTENSCTTHPHNIYLEILAENGLIGLSIFLLFLGNLLSKVLHNTRGLINQPIMFGAAMTLLIKFLPIVSSGSFYVAWSTASLWLMMGILNNHLSNYIVINSGNTLVSCSR